MHKTPLSDLSPDTLLRLFVYGGFAGLLILCWPDIVKWCRSLREAFKGEPIPRSPLVPDKTPQAAPDAPYRHAEGQQAPFYLHSEGVPFDAEWQPELPTFAAVVETLPKSTCTEMTGKAGDN